VKWGTRTELYGAIDGIKLSARTRPHFARKQIPVRTAGRGHGFPANFRGKPMASLLRARRQHLAATLVFLANAETVRPWEFGVGAGFEMCALAKQSPFVTTIVIPMAVRVLSPAKARAHWNFSRLVPN